MHTQNAGEGGDPRMYWRSVGEVMSASFQRFLQREFEQPKKVEAPSYDILAVDSCYHQRSSSISSAACICVLKPCPQYPWCSPPHTTSTSGLHRTDMYLQKP